MKPDKSLFWVFSVVGLGAFSLGWVLLRAASQPPSPSAVPSTSSAPVVEATPPLAPSAVSAPPTWTQADLRALSGRWVGTKFGDAIPRGPLGGSITPMGVRAVFEEGRAGSKTPWNVTIWAPRQDHMTPETISMGCGFYVRLHEGEGDGGEEAAFRTAYCKGYGLAAGASHATTIRLTVRGDGALRVQVGSMIDVEVARP